ncbi:MAG: HlyD family secretion protein [Phycisphaeraceae bacterium]|nr:HlyD family secretion protein [Phycisphaeraceae bacterium]MCW5754173.1 HlyD family secretion protein [Phycisphaeraceae bacterium]
MWKWVLGASLAIVVLCGGGGYLLLKQSSLVGKRDTTTLVRTVTVSRKDLTRSVSAPGIVESRSNRRISAQVVARIKKLPFRQGERVREGDIIVQLDDEEFQAALESAQAGLRSASARELQANVAKASAEATLRSQQAAHAGTEAAYREALAEVGRSRELYDSGDVPKSELDRAEATYLQAASRLRSAEAAIEIANQEIQRAQAEVLAAGASVDIAKANIRRAQKDLQNCTIRAPINGLITLLEAEEGELVLVGTFNNPASVIMEIADLDDMILKARVSESSIAFVAEEQTARVYFNAYPATVFEGTVERIGHLRRTWRDGTNYFEVDVPVRLRPDSPLRSGLSASCEIDVQTVKNALQVPSQAVLNRRVDELPREIVDASTIIDVTRPFTTVVFRMHEGRALAVPVRVGVSDLANTVILEGLEGSENIIVGPSSVLQTLRHGQAVRTDEAPTVPAHAHAPSSSDAPESIDG